MHRSDSRKTLKVSSGVKLLCFCKNREFCIHSKNTALCNSLEAEQDILSCSCWHCMAWQHAHTVYTCVQTQNTCVQHRWTWPKPTFGFKLTFDACTFGSFYCCEIFIKLVIHSYQWFKKLVWASVFYFVVYLKLFIS